MSLEHLINMYVLFLLSQCFSSSCSWEPSNKYYLFILIVCLVEVLPIFPKLKNIPNAFYCLAQHFHSNLQLKKGKLYYSMSNQQRGKCRMLPSDVWPNLLLQSLVHIDSVHNNPKGIVNLLGQCLVFLRRARLDTAKLQVMSN